MGHRNRQLSQDRESRHCRDILYSRFMYMVRAVCGVFFCRFMHMSGSHVIWTTFTMQSSSLFLYDNNP
jgi:hypothetical protein